MAGVQGDLSMPPVPPGMDMSPLPPPAPPAPDPVGAAATAPGPPQMDFSRGDALIAGMGDPLARTNSMIQQNRAALAPLQAGAQRAGREYQQAAANVPPRPQQAAPDPQRGMGLQAAGEWVMIATGLGAIAGALTRRSTTNALAAFTGAMEGVATGNKQAFEQNRVIWEQENKRINQQLQQDRDAYLDILNSKKMNWDMKVLELQQEAARRRDDVMMQLAAQRNVTAIAQRTDKLEELRVKGVQEYQRAQERLGKALGAGAQSKSGLSDEAAQRIAEQMDAGMKQPSNLTRADMEKIQNMRGNKSPEDLKNAQFDYTRGQSAARTGGTIEERVNYATNELKSAIPLALEASNNLPRGQFVPINKIVQMGQAATSNQQYNDFILKTNALAKAYGRAMNPQGVPRVSENKEAEAKGILSTAISREAYETQAKALWQEATNAQRAALATRPGAAPLPSPFDAGGGAQAKPSGGMDLGGGWSVR